MITALVGRRIDAAGAERPRFPPENIDLVRGRLCELLAKERPGALVSSAACGADLIALDEAGALGIRRRVILPFDRERFRETSVIDRPGPWGGLYDRLMNEIEANGDLVTLAGDTDDTRAYAAANRVIFAETEALSRKLQQAPAAIIVWDGASRGANDMTKSFGDEARGLGFHILEIRTL